MGDHENITCGSPCCLGDLAPLEEILPSAEHSASEPRLVRGPGKLAPFQDAPLLALSDVHTHTHQVCQFRQSTVRDADTLNNCGWSQQPGHGMPGHAMLCHAMPCHVATESPFLNHPTVMQPRAWPSTNKIHASRHRRCDLACRTAARAASAAALACAAAMASAVDRRAWPAEAGAVAPLTNSMRPEALRCAARRFSSAATASRIGMRKSSSGMLAGSNACGEGRRWERGVWGRSCTGKPCRDQPRQRMRLAGAGHGPLCGHGRRGLVPPSALHPPPRKALVPPSPATPQPTSGGKHDPYCWMP